MGRNVDLVFQSRLADYRVDQWEQAVYGTAPRSYYDAWDKQACVVPVSDWPERRLYHAYFDGIWRPRVLAPYPEAVEKVEGTIRERGPSSAADLADLDLPGSDDGGRKGSWFGPRLINHVLKALWFTGRLVTHHRKNGRHVYAPADAVVPDEILARPPDPPQQTLEWLVLRRHQSAGLLRPGAGKPVFSLPPENAPLRSIIQGLVERGDLVPIEVEGVLFHGVREQIEMFANDGPSTGAVRFLAPLDSLLWDRKAVRHLYEFDYVWEVYKPAEKRIYGYYVLPVMYGTELVGRVEFTRKATGALSATAWWEERHEARLRDDEFLGDLADALRRFRVYAGADEVVAEEQTGILAAATRAIRSDRAAALPRDRAAGPSPSSS